MAAELAYARFDATFVCAMLIPAGTPDRSRRSAPASGRARVREVWDRYYCAEAHARHILFREETRWPGYYYRGDFPKLDETNWKCFTTSRYDPGKNEWSLQKKPCIAPIP